MQTFERLQNTVQRFPGHGIDEVAEPLRIVVVYENTAAHVRALHIHDYLITHLGKEMPLLFSWWSFDLLQESGYAELAARAMRSADLVMFSVQSADEWPEAVDSWLSGWARHRTEGPGAVAAIFFHAAARPGKMCGRHAALHSAAEKSGMDFLAEEIGHLPARAPAQTDRLIERFSSPPIAQNIGPADSSPYWGING